METEAAYRPAAVSVVSGVTRYEPTEWDLDNGINQGKRPLARERLPAVKWTKPTSPGARHRGGSGQLGVRPAERLLRGRGGTRQGRLGRLENRSRRQTAMNSAALFDTTAGNEQARVDRDIIA